MGTDSRIRAVRKYLTFGVLVTMAGLVRRGISRVKADRAVLFVCDIQDRFRPLIHNMETVINQTKFLSEVSDVMGIPTVVTEQYPKAFGKTCSDLNLEGKPCFEKKQFSMMTDEVTEHFKSLGRDQVIMCGIEGHVCVMQTVLDLLEQDVEVHLVTDAISSQRPNDRSMALERMRDSGATLSTMESTVFELLRSAAHPDFRTISGKLKDHLGGVPNDFTNQATL